MVLLVPQLAVVRVTLVHVQLAIQEQTVINIIVVTFLVQRAAVDIATDLFIVFIHGVNIVSVLILIIVTLDGSVENMHSII